MGNRLKDMFEGIWDCICDFISGLRDRFSSPKCVYGPPPKDIYGPPEKEDLQPDYSEDILSNKTDESAVNHQTDTSEEPR